MMKRIAIVFFLIIFYNQLMADWPIGKHRTTLIPTYTYFRSAKFYDSSGKVISFGSGDQFVSNTFSLFMAHGISRRLDFIVNLPYSSVRSSFNGVSQSKSGFGDAQIGFALHFPSKDLKQFFTTKAIFILPLYQNLKEPYLGFASKGIQLAVNYSFNPLPQTYLITEAYYTRYFDEVTGPNQFGYSITGGTMFLDYNYISANLAGVISSSSDKGFNTNLLVNKDFSYGKISLAYGRKIFRNITPYVQGFYTIYGKNAGVGYGVSLFAIIKLP